MKPRQLTKLEVLKTAAFLSQKAFELTEEREDMLNKIKNIDPKLFDMQSKLFFKDFDNDAFLDRILEEADGIKNCPLAKAIDTPVGTYIIIVKMTIIPTVSGDKSNVLKGVLQYIIREDGLVYDSYDDILGAHST